MFIIRFNLGGKEKKSNYKLNLIVDYFFFFVGMNFQRKQTRHGIHKFLDRYFEGIFLKDL